MKIPVLLIFCLLSLSSADKCKSQDQCLYLNNCVSGKCSHKALFPLASTEIAGTFIMTIVAIIANAGGLGGSVVSISLMLVLFGFDAHGCVAETQVFVFGGTATATLLKFWDRHPTKDRPLIYYDVLMQIASPILLGVTIGVILNAAFPSWLLLALLTITIGFLLWGVAMQFVKVRRLEKSETQVSDLRGGNNGATVGNVTESPVRKENEEREMVLRADGTRGIRGAEGESENGIENGGERDGQVRRINEEEVADEDESSEPEINPNVLRRVSKIIEDEKRLISWVPLSYFLLLAASSILFSAFKNDSIPAKIGKCSSGFIAAHVIYVVFMISMASGAAYYAVNKTKVLEAGRYQFDEGDIKWNYPRCALMFVGSLAAGVIVGLLGLGGGSILSPLLLALGVRPEISTISSSFVISISSLTASAQYFISGAEQVEYSAWFFMLSVIGSGVGILALRAYVIRKKIVSYLVLCIGVIFIAAIIIIPTIGVINSIQQHENGNFQLGFKGLC
jgi:uncharacterized membrane protein YfcA